MENRHIPEGLQLLLPFPIRGTQIRAAFQKFYRLIPTEAKTLAAKSPVRQWHVLQLVNRVGAPARDLCDSILLEKGALTAFQVELIRRALTAVGVRVEAAEFETLEGVVMDSLSGERRKQ